MVKLALVSVDRVEALPPLGLGYLASYLRKYNNFYNTIIVDKEDQIKCLRREKPDVIGISCTSLDFEKARALAIQVKDEFDVPVLLGGFHVTALPSFMPKCFDIGVLGEGEQTLSELVELYERKGSFEEKELKKIKGICFQGKKGIVINERRKNIEPLDSIPMPARDLMKIKEYYLKPSRHSYDKLSIGTSIITNRGCCFNCVFCAQQNFWGRTMRFHSPERVAEEVIMLLEKYPKIEMIKVMDDLFVIDKKRLEKISELLRKEKVHEKIEFYVYARTSLMDAKTCKILRSFNVNYLNFGLESGSERILNYLKRGTTTVKQHYNALELCRKYGFKAEGTFIVGTPGETMEDIQKTFDLVRNPNLKRVLFFQLMAAPQTELWDFAKKKGLVSDEMDFSKLTASWNKEGFLNDEVFSFNEFEREVIPLVNEVEGRKNYGYGLLSFKLNYLFNLYLYKRFFQNFKGFSKEFFYRFLFHLNLKKKGGIARKI